MTNYRYVMISADGRSWLLEGDQCYDANIDHNSVMPRLLNEGWQPLREHRLGEGLLVLMEKCEMREIASGNDIPF